MVIEVGQLNIPYDLLPTNREEKKIKKRKRLRKEIEREKRKEKKKRKNLELFHRIFAKHWNNNFFSNNPLCRIHNIKNITIHIQCYFLISKRKREKEKKRKRENRNLAT